ncbi:MAG: hypothetical protein LUD02_08570 [Tannerellaceae bacterium]|nr:hypothetical protein [Tannerellaceae bacterium]
MKTGKFLSKCLLLCMALVMSACGDDDYISSIENGEFFARANSVRFYYLDSEGNDLINPKDLTTLPFSYYESEELPQEVIIPDDYKDGFYNKNWNTVFFDQEEGLYYMSTTVEYNSAGRQP